MPGEKKDDDEQFLPAFGPGEAGPVETGPAPAIGGGGGFSGWDLAATKYSAYCDAGTNHAAWFGPYRSTRREAQLDADAHNRSCDARGAVVVSPS